MVLMDLFAGQQKRCRPREQICGHSEGKKGWDELISVETYITIYKIENQWKFAV